VFVGAKDEESALSLEVQTGIVQELDGVVDVRFVDEAAEAIDTSDPSRPVHEHGVLITLGVVTPVGRVVTIEAERYEHAGATRSWSVTVRQTGSTWRATREGM
jgi:hypothetical protein